MFFSPHRFDLLVSLQFLMRRLGLDVEGLPVTFAACVPLFGSNIGVGARGVRGSGVEFGGPKRQFGGISCGRVWWNFMRLASKMVLRLEGTPLKSLGVFFPASPSVNVYHPAVFFPNMNVSFTGLPPAA